MPIHGSSAPALQDVDRIELLPGDGRCAPGPHHWLIDNVPPPAPPPVPAIR